MIQPLEIEETIQWLRNERLSIWNEIINFPNDDDNESVNTN